MAKSKDLTKFDQVQGWPETPPPGSLDDLSGDLGMTPFWPGPWPVVVTKVYSTLESVEYTVVLTTGVRAG